MMELIKKLGTRTTVSASGKKTTRGWGLFKCPSCGENVERLLTKGKRNNSCGSSGCRKAASNNYKPWNSSMDDSIKKNRQPYYSAISDYYRVLKKNNTLCDSWSTLSGFMDDMYTSYVDIRATGSSKATIKVNDSEVLSADNCIWVPTIEDAINVDVLKSNGNFNSRMIASELNVRPYVVTRALSKMDSTFGAYTYELVELSPTLSVKAYKLTEYQYTRLKDTVQANKKSTSNNVYLIECEGATKIGITNDINRRLCSLTGSSPSPMKLLYSKKIDNALVVEKHLHNKYHEYNKHHEWFNLTEEQIKEIIDYLDKQ